jgi:ABC-type transport system involved in multi-copper enzyme maturation permease subunit
MNAFTVRALFRDAYYQVIDNLGFRILAVLFLLPLAAALIVGFREEGVVLLFHWEYSYESFAGPIGLWLGDDAGTRANLIDGASTVLIDVLADKFGLVFGVAAISFFVPHMLERGSADTVFSKPVSRFALLMSRYVAGLIFVTILAILLVGGIYLGFLIGSRHHDPGLLWSIVTLCYGFAIFHALSCLAGVVTRSAIAAILLTMVFLPTNWSCHAWWESLDAEARARAAAEERGVKKDAEPEHWAMSVLRTTVEVMHFVLPKTSDGTRIAQSLRRSFERSAAEFEDGELGLRIADAPAGFRREPRSSLTQSGLLWIAPHPGDRGEARWTLRKEAEDGTSRKEATKALRQKLAAAPEVSEVKPPERENVSNSASERHQWHEKRGDEVRLRRQWIFQVGSDLLTLDYDAELEWALDEENERSAREFFSAIHVSSFQERIEASTGPPYGWTAPWRYNFWFSIATTLAFIAAVLGLAGWRLSRIDF